VTYREQEYTERPGASLVLRCYCDAPAEVNCATCRRARCAQHVQRGLCSRCASAVERELSASSSKRWWISTSAGFAFAFAMLMLEAFGRGSLGLMFVGLPIAVTLGEVLRRRARARLMRELRPKLATTVGELPPPPSEEPFPEASKRFHY
jgi:hypothetical protein